MLVLSRQRDETIMIGDEIEITVVDIRGDKIRLGISAPAKIAVHRKEVYEAIRRENEQAREMSPDFLPQRLAPGPAKIGPGRSASRLALGRNGGLAGTGVGVASGKAPAARSAGTTLARDRTTPAPAGS